jgi:hypothetical protein
MLQEKIVFLLLFNHCLPDRAENTVLFAGRYLAAGIHAILFRVLNIAKAIRWDVRTLVIHSVCLMLLFT